MDKYSKHFLLNVDTAKEYAKEKVEYFKDDETLDAIEIGDRKIPDHQTGRYSSSLFRKVTGYVS